MNEHKILEEAFKEEFGDNWQIEMRDFEHGFSSFYDASINAIKRALVLSNVVGRSEQLPQNFCTLNRQTCGKGSGCKYPHCHL